MKTQYEVIVIGGGPAGFSAALAAAEQGRSVLLVEKHNCLGGAACGNLIYPFMMYWTRDPLTNEKVYLSGGTYTRVLRAMEAFDGACRDTDFAEETLKLVLNRMAITAGVELLFNTTLGDVVTEKGRVKSITVYNVGGKTTLTADYFVDGTGNGDLCVRAGCAYELGRPKDHLCQPMTLCFRVCGVDVDLFYRELGDLQKAYQEAQKQGTITNPRENILTFRSPIEGVLHFNSTRVVKLNPTDAADVSRAEILAREQMYELFFFIKQRARSFEHASLLSSAIEIGARESRMILGDYVLTGEDLLANTKFRDGICCANYDMDIHSPDGTGTSHYYFKPGDYYTIPYRCLTPKGFDNLLVAGRCISSTHEAQASYRVMNICYTIGQAAGLAAAQAYQNGQSVHEIDTDVLRDTLRKNGAILEVRFTGSDPKETV